MKKWEQKSFHPDDELVDVPLTKEEAATFPTYYGIEGLPVEAKAAVIRYMQEAQLRKKKAISVRIDDDVLTWLKSSGEGYQTRLNAILRQAMLNDIAKK
jgi:uncharacterized protein (DUF4415 family)